MSANICSVWIKKRRQQWSLVIWIAIILNVTKRKSDVKGYDIFLDINREKNGILGFYTTMLFSCLDTQHLSDDTQRCMSTLQSTVEHENAQINVAGLHVLWGNLNDNKMLLLYPLTRQELQRLVTQIYLNSPLDRPTILNANFVLLR